MRGPRIRYRRQKACERYHLRMPDARTPSALLAQQRRLDRAPSLISMLVALTDRCHSALLLSPQPHLIADSADVLCINRRSWRVPLTGRCPRGTGFCVEHCAPMLIPVLSFCHDD
jgi:hypothetical protein